MFTWLSGYKTYLIAALMVLLAGLHSQGYIGDGLFETLRTILIGGGLASLRAAVAKAS